MKRIKSIIETLGASFLPIGEGVFGRFLLIILMAFGIASHQVFAAEITTSVDRNPVSIDESFKIF
ncbi:MAG: hypothetical protein ABL884_12100, partial [Methyloglobulus sp.]